ncbi:putative signal transduction histidine kinase [Candidatus Sulfotelmatobacter kueseliae]|uniref:Oxygen sensor histidine kinase NreB n=1 Tax=Candidatus Sulfotelmatobacter kueseliae TaxID=2042962 RepID=A0A2U3KUD9_9BACT|nr:putative signal transduction histidine kinase [Candidatus Sulfotelmatobacter kueseliae]
MPSYAERYRQSWRLQIAPDPSETRRVERWLATARVFLAAAALAAIRMDPTELGHSWAAYGLFVFYLANGILIMMLLRRRQQSTAAFRVLVHAGDIVWPALISIFAEGPRSPFFLFFFFVLAAAAYRWGLWETLGTAAAEVALLWMGGFVLLHGWLGPGGSPALRQFLGLRVNLPEFEPERLFMLSVYLIVMGLLLGYLAEQQKSLRAEKTVITRFLSRVRVEDGLTGTMQRIFQETAAMYGASRLLVASQESHSHRVFLGELNKASDGAFGEFRWLDSKPADASTYLDDFPGEVCHAASKKGRWFILALDRDGNPLPAADPSSISRVRDAQTFGSLITVAFLFGEEWRGRVFLFDPFWQGEKQEELRFLLNLVQQVGPAIYNVYLLHRLRRRAGAAERARVARELHDGAVQSLIAVEMQVDVLRRQAEAKRPISEELGRIQGLLREEVLKLRELMQQMKAIDVDAQRLLGVLSDAVERFQRETGISARFVTDVEELDMPQRVCREVLRIVQEGLVNVRKHSGARHALVRLGCSRDQWNLTIEDDGKGFPFAGRLNHDQMESVGKGPMIIKERVRLIAGELTVESTPGKGTRLEITLPREEVPHEF